MLTIRAAHAEDRGAAHFRDELSIPRVQAQAASIRMISEGNQSKVPAACWWISPAASQVSTNFVDGPLSWFGSLWETITTDLTLSW